MLKTIIIAAACGGMLAGSVNAAENLCFNGSFDYSPNPLEGWTYNYAFLGNKNYMDNHTKVSAEAKGGGRSSVVRIKSTSDAGAKIESKPIPFERGYRYTCKMKLKDGPVRIYFAGYKWKPGIRPHANPAIGELRTIYKSKAYTKANKGWSTIELKLPGVKASPLSIKHLSRVRFITVYIWTLGEIYVDDIEVTRVKDNSLGK
jgi:hypothetical protein